MLLYILFKRSVNTFFSKKLTIFLGFLSIFNLSKYNILVYIPNNINDTGGNINFDPAKLKLKLDQYKINYKAAVLVVA